MSDEVKQTRLLAALQKCSWWTAVICEDSFLLCDVIYTLIFLLVFLCSVTSSRENMMYTVDCLRDDM